MAMLVKWNAISENCSLVGFYPVTNQIAKFFCHIKDHKMTTSYNKQIGFYNFGTLSAFCG